MFCIKCGQELAAGSEFCSKCGNPVKAPVVILNDGFNVLIPRNVLALWSYYLGIFSLIGGITSIPSIVTGILGLKYAKTHPEAKGVIHCWVGIAVGSLSLLFLILFIENGGIIDFFTISKLPSL